MNEAEVSEAAQVDGRSTAYDALKRDPLYSNAAKSCLWELIVFTNHFHPTVALYAQTLVKGEPVNAPNSATHYDPLANHTLQQFLDRFVYKAPKSVKSAFHGSSIMQPRGGSLWTAKKRQVVVGGKHTDDLPPNLVDAANLDLPDEEFFKNYFNFKAPKKAKKVMELEDDGGEFDEDEVFDAMSKSMNSNELPPDFEGRQRW